MAFLPAPETTPRAAVSTAEIERVLRAHLAAHNLRAALFAGLTLIGAAAAWTLLHGAAQWLTLLFVTAVRGVEAHPPPYVDRIFWSAACALLVLAWIDRRLHPDDRPTDHKSALQVVWECVLAIPHITLSVWSTLSAWQRLEPGELSAAAALVERLTHEPRLPLHSLPLDIPNADARFKILLALQLTQVIDIRREDRDHWITLHPLRPRELTAQPASSRR